MYAPELFSYFKQLFENSSLIAGLLQDSLARNENLINLQLITGISENTVTESWSFYYNFDAIKTDPGICDA